MPGYTSEEVQACIDKFLLGTVSTPQTNLGMRDVLTARDDIYGLLTTTLLLRPDSYFYIIWLAKNRLEALRRAQQADLDFLLEDTTSAALRRRGSPVENTTELTNAQAALLNINAGINAGTGSRTRSLGPEVDRFRKSIERFVTAALVPNVVEAGTPTETAGELQTLIASKWVEVTARHEQMLVLCAAIQDAVSALSAAQLPQKAIQAVVTRLETRLGELSTELLVDRSLSTHREVMLELLTMRTLLTKVSTFRTPARMLAPLGGDSKLLTGVGGASPAALLGTLSGPFNVPYGSSLDLETGAPVVSSSIPLGYSNAESSSRDLTYPLTFPVGASLRLIVDGVLYPSQSHSAVTYLTDTDFLAALTLYLTTAPVPATASIVGSQIRIRSDSAGDTSSVEVRTTSMAEQSFWQTTGFSLAACTPVPAADIITAGVPFPKVRLSEARTEHGNFRGVTAAASTLDLSIASGTLTGSGTSFEADINLESAGVRAQDRILIGAQVRTIASVDGASLELTSTATAGAFVVGPDLILAPAGARAIVTSDDAANTGYYRVVSGGIGELVLDRAFSSLGAAVTVFIVESYLVAKAPGVTTSDGITAWPASDGATAVGFTPSATQEKAELTSVSSAVDFFARGVSTGDLLTTGASTSLITAVLLNSLQVEGVPYFSGTQAYTIESSRYLAWLSLVTATQAFVTGDNFVKADFAITRLLSGASPAVLLGAGGPIADYWNLVADLGDIQNYEVPFERCIDNIMRMLVEQGLDRSADLLTSLQVAEFFGMHPDGCSYATNLVRTAADVTRQVAPVSRFAKSFWAHPEVRLLSTRRSG